MKCNSRKQMSEMVKRQFETWLGVLFMPFGVPDVDVRGE